MSKPALIQRSIYFSPIIWVFTGLLIFVIAIIFKLDDIRTAFRGHRIKVALNAARGLCGQGRLDLALLRLGEVLRKYPQDRDLLTLVATIHEAMGDPKAVVFWRRVFETAPEDIKANLDLATALIHFGQVPEAKAILDSLVSKPEEKTTPHNSKIHELRGLTYMALNEYQSARSEFLKALRFDPGSDTAAFNAIIAWLCSEPSEADAALASLKSFSGRPKFAERAAAVWVEAAIRHPAIAPTVEEKKRLLHALEKETTPGSFHYKLYLDAVALWCPEQLPDLLHQLLREQGDRPWLLAGYLRHLRARGQSQLVRQFLVDFQSNTVLNHPHLALLDAEMAQEASDIQGLQRALERPSWDTMQTAALAFKLWLARETKIVSGNLLASLLQRGKSDPDGLAYVALLLEKWGLPEAVDAWHSLAFIDPFYRRIALPIAETRYLETHQTEKLLDLYAELASTSAGDPNYEIKAIYLSLLLENFNEELIERAERLVKNSPTNVDAICCYAFAAFKLGDFEKARMLLSSLTESSFCSSASALIGAVVKTHDDPETAAALLDRAEKEIRLPEERKIADMVRKDLTLRVGF